MIRHTLLLCTLAAGLSAETIYVSKAGKTFHRVETCMALTRSKTKLAADRKIAETHGLKPCGICYRPSAAKKADNGQWAKGGK